MRMMRKLYASKKATYREEFMAPGKHSVSIVIAMSEETTDTASL